MKFYFLGTRASNNALADILIEANATGRFWIGASDLEEVGHFKWFYSGKTIPQIHWDNKGKPKDEEEAIKLDMVCTYKVILYISSAGRSFLMKYMPGPCGECFAFTPHANFPAHNLNFH